MRIWNDKVEAQHMLNYAPEKATLDDKEVWMDTFISHEDLEHCQFFRCWHERNRVDGDGPSSFLSVGMVEGYGVVLERVWDKKVGAYKHEFVHLYTSSIEAGIAFIERWRLRNYVIDSYRVGEIEKGMQK